MTANNMHSVDDPSRSGVQLDLTNHKGVRGFRGCSGAWREKRAFGNMGSNWVTEFQSWECALGTLWYVSEETETHP